MKPIKVLNHNATNIIGDYRIRGIDLQNPKDSEKLGEQIENLLNDNYVDNRAVNILIHEVDFEILKKQINAIYKAQTALTAIGGKENMDIVENLDGIVIYLDTLRDIASDIYDYPYNVVFD